MDALFTYILYGIALCLLGFSFFKDRRKTSAALKRAWHMFLNVLPQFAAILLLMGLLLVILEPAAIERLIGAESGFLGLLLSALIGSVTLIPVLIAFPIAAELLANGAGIVQMAVFISTLTTVGLVTLPLEIRYLGKKVAVLRNLLAFLFSFVAAFVVGVVLR